MMIMKAKSDARTTQSRLISIALIVTLFTTKLLYGSNLLFDCCCYFFQVNDKISRSPLRAIFKFTACLLQAISFSSVLWFSVSVLLIRQHNSLCAHRDY